MISETHLEDCMIGMKQYPDKWFDLAVVDPPYGMDKSSLNGSGKLKHRALNRMNTDWDISPDSEYFEQLFRISKNQIIWGGNYFQLPPSRGFIIWDKKQMMPTFSRCEYAWLSMYIPSKIFAFSNADDSKIHPTQKPIALYSWIYDKYLHSGGKVIDTHLGSGSNRIAADKAGNIDFYGWEIDKDYFEAQEKRFKNYKSQLTLWTPNYALTANTR